MEYQILYIYIQVTEMEANPRGRLCCIQYKVHVINYQGLIFCLRNSVIIIYKLQLTGSLHDFCSMPSLSVSLVTHVIYFDIK